MASIIYDDKELMKSLLESGTHFGHQTKRWNPKMKPYIFIKRNGIHIIDLRNTIKTVKNVYAEMKDFTAEGKTVLFVGTKRQAAQAITEEAQRCNMPYVSKRWLGGILTNFANIRQSIEKMKRYEKKLSRENVKMTKKERLLLEKTVKKLNSYYDGIRDMDKLPDALWVVDLKREANAIHEARTLGIKIFGMADTNCDPDLLDYLVPGNDDAIRSVRLITSLMADAIIEGSNINSKNEESEMDERSAEEIMEASVENAPSAEENSEENTKEK